MLDSGASDPGFDPRTVRYTGGSDDLGSAVSGSSLPWLKVASSQGARISKKGGSNVTNQPSVSDWVIQVPLWPSGLGIGLWSEQPGVRSPHGLLHIDRFYGIWLSSMCTLTSIAIYLSYCWWSLGMDEWSHPTVLHRCDKLLIHTLIPMLV